MHLTAQEDATYRFIKKFIQRHQYAPTEAEIAAGIGIQSRGVVHRYVTALSNAGLLNIIPGKRRNITLKEVASPLALPLIGTIAAGAPIEALQTTEWLDLGSKLLGRNHFLLRVKGQSMLNEGIHDGDLVICAQAETAENGAIIVALIDGETATLKRFYQNPDGSVTLIPANAAYAPIVYDAERIQIQGIYQGLFRLAT